MELHLRNHFCILMLGAYWHSWWCKKCEEYIWPETRSSWSNYQGSDEQGISILHLSCMLSEKLCTCRKIISEFLLLLPGLAWIRFTRGIMTDRWAELTLLGALATPTWPGEDRFCRYWFVSILSSMWISVAHSVGSDCSFTWCIFSLLKILSLN